MANFNDVPEGFSIHRHMLRRLHILPKRPRGSASALILYFEGALRAEARRG
jgi:hypothetical protein